MRSEGSGETQASVSRGSAVIPGRTRLAHDSAIAVTSKRRAQLHERHPPALAARTRTYLLDAPEVQRISAFAAACVTSVRAREYTWNRKRARLASDYASSTATANTSSSSKMTGRGYRLGAAPPFSPTSSDRFRNLGRSHDDDDDDDDTADGSAPYGYRHYDQRYGYYHEGEDEEFGLYQRRGSVVGAGAGAPRPRLVALSVEDSARTSRNRHHHRSVHPGSSAYLSHPPSVHVGSLHYPRQYQQGDEPEAHARGSSPHHSERQPYAYSDYAYAPSRDDNSAAPLRGGSRAPEDRMSEDPEVEHGGHSTRHLYYSLQQQPERHQHHRHEYSHPQQQQQFHYSRSFTGKRKAGEPRDEFGGYSSRPSDNVHLTHVSSSGYRPHSSAGSSYFAHHDEATAMPAQTRRFYRHPQQQRDDHHHLHPSGSFRGSDSPTLQPWQYQRQGRSGTARVAMTAAGDEGDAAADRARYQRARSLSPQPSSSSSPPPPPPPHQRAPTPTLQTSLGIAQPSPPLRPPSTPPPVLPSHGRVIANASRNINFGMLQPHFERPLQEAALHFGVCTTLLKKICRKNGIKNWPYRRICGLHKSIASMEKQVHYFDGEQKQSYADQLYKLQLELAAYKRTGSAPTPAFIAKIQAEGGIGSEAKSASPPPSATSPSLMVRGDVAEAKSEDIEIEASYHGSSIEINASASARTSLSTVSTRVSIASYRYLPSSSPASSYADEDEVEREREQSYYSGPQEEFAGVNRVMASTVDLGYDDDGENQRRYSHEDRDSPLGSQWQYSQRQQQYQQHRHHQQQHRHQNQQRAAHRTQREQREATGSSSRPASASSSLLRRTLPSLSFMLHRGESTNQHYEIDEEEASVSPANQPRHHHRQQHS